MRAFVAALALLSALPLLGQQFPPGYVDPAPLLAAAAKEIGEANCGASRSPAPATAVRWARRSRTRSTSTGRGSIDGQLHAHHQLGNRDEQGDLRSQAGPEPRLMEVRARLAGWHADSEGHASDAHRQRQVRVAHRRQRAARGGSA